MVTTLAAPIVAHLLQQPLPRPQLCGSIGRHGSTPHIKVSIKLMGVSKQKVRSTTAAYQEVHLCLRLGSAVLLLARSARRAHAEAGRQLLRRRQGEADRGVQVVDNEATDFALRARTRHLMSTFTAISTSHPFPHPPVLCAFVSSSKQ